MKPLLMTILFFISLFTSNAQSDVKSNFKFVFQKTSDGGSSVYLLMDKELFLIEKSEFPSITDEPISNKYTLASSRAWYIGAGCIYWANYSNDKIEIKKQMLEETSQNLPITTVKTFSMSSININKDLSILLKSAFGESSTSNSADKFAGKWKCQLEGSSSFFYYELKKTGATIFSGQWFGDNTFSKGGQTLTWHLIDGTLQKDNTVISIINDDELLQKQGNSVYKFNRVNTQN